jgi:hypothetical protein
MRAKAQFWSYFELVYPIGESSREKTGTEGEVLRGTGGIFALFLCIPALEVRVFGSEAVFRPDLRCVVDEVRRSLGD